MMMTNDDTICNTQPVLKIPIKEPVNSLSIGDEHLDTILATESDEVIKSSVEDLVPILSESEGILDKMCDVPLCENTTPLNALNEHSEIVVNSNDDNSSSDDDSPYGEDIDYVDASHPVVEIVSLEVVELFFPEVKKSSSSTTTHDDFSQYDSFTFDLSNDQFPPANRSDFHEEFADELAQIMSNPNLEFYQIKIEPDPEI
ncbi:hypothetical protein Tco_0642528 [Tanacetum coccineum]